jgi:hypothetical protein
MKSSAMRAEQFQTSRDGATRAMEDASGLTVSDLGSEAAHQLEMQTRLPQSVVEAEGLDGEGSPAGAASESLNRTSVAFPTESAVKSVAEARTTRSGAA